MLLLHRCTAVTVRICRVKIAVCWLNKNNTEWTLRREVWAEKRHVLCFSENSVTEHRRVITCLWWCCESATDVPWFCCAVVDVTGAVSIKLLCVLFRIAQCIFTQFSLVTVSAIFRWIRHWRWFPTVSCLCVVSSRPDPLIITHTFKPCVKRKKGKAWILDIALLTGV